MAQKAFETVFRSACESVDWETSTPDSATTRFLDLKIIADSGSERKLSLKSTAAKNLSQSTLHISKLTEAAWVQDMRAASHRQERTQELFEQYLNAVDSIMMLRAFRTGQEVPSKYQLVEIPTEIFRSLLDAPQAAFSADGPTIDCAYAGLDVAARVHLDRSDAKITIKQIQLAACIEHVTWEMVSSRNS